MKKYVLLLVLSVIASFICGYKVSSLEFEEYKQQEAKNYAELLEQKIKSDTDNRKRISELEKEHLTVINEQKVKHEKVIRDIYANFKPSGVQRYTASSNSLSRKTGDSGNLICYTKAGLQRKIAETVAIGLEADGLAVKYNTLLKISEDEG